MTRSRTISRYSSATIAVIFVATVLLALSTQSIYAQQQRCPGAPNQCSLHGTCVINRQGEYTCNCQWGYHGADCAKKMCPHGFDPTSSFTQEKKLRLTISPSSTIVAPANARMQGSLMLSFHAHSVEFETPLQDVTSEVCTSIFKRFQNLGEVSCVRTALELPATATYEITLHSFPVLPIMNNLYRHDGNPLSTDFWCDPSGVQLQWLSGATGTAPSLPSIKCSFESITDSAVKPYQPCSAHGLCNDRTGTCTCENGFYGENCASHQDAEDILVAPSTGPFFQGNVLRVSAQRTASTEFNMIKADIAGATVFTMDGQGDTVFHTGAVHVKQGHLLVQDGQVRVQNGGKVVLESADLKVQNGHFHLVATTPSTMEQTTPLVHIEMTTPLAITSSTADLIRVSKQHAIPLVRVSAAGTLVVHEGGMEVLKGGIRVQRGGVHVLSDGVHVMHGGVDVHHDGVHVREGDVLIENGGLRVESNGENGQPVLKLTQSSTRRSTSAVLHLETTKDADQSFLSANLVGSKSPVFQVKSNGRTEIHAGGLLVESGGVVIASGGQVIESGGLRVQAGGIEIESGPLVTNGGFTIQEGGLQVQTSTVNGPLLALSSFNAQYAGSMLAFTLHSNQTARSDPSFCLMEAFIPAKEGSNARTSIVSIDSQGHLLTQGDVRTKANGRIISSGPLVSEAQVVFSHIKRVAGASITIPSTHSYVQITNDGTNAANIVQLDTTNAYSGQLLVIQNEDEERLHGDVSVAPYSAAIFVFDGRAWRALTAASFDTSVITGVKQFEAANDLNFGEIKLTVHSLQVGNQRMGGVAIYGKGGELTQDASFVYDNTTSTLTVPKLQAQMIKGRVDMSESELRGIEIVGGHISHVNMTDLDMVHVNGELLVESQAFFGEGITVDGQVMGSGAYIDASDKRFKRAIEPITVDQASDWVAQLQGVKYHYRTEAFPSKRFRPRQEIGFVAQEVEAILPQVVEEDADGYKYVAYARVVPVLVEALKDTQQKQMVLQKEVDTLRQELVEMRALLLQQLDKS